MQRQQQHERDEADEFRPVARDQREREHARDDEQELLEPELARERVQREIGGLTPNCEQRLPRVDAGVGVEQFDGPGAMEQVDENEYAKCDTKDGQRAGVDRESRANVAPE